MMHVTAIILAAGEGRRIGGDLPKPYLPIAGRPLVLRALDRIFSSPHVEAVILIVAAHEQAERDGLEVTDDAMAVERLGKPVYLVEGERTNFKITLPEDVWLAEVLIREGKVP